MPPSTLGPPPGTHEAGNGAFNAITDGCWSWMNAVDRACEVMFGVSVHDLPDAPFRDWFDAGVKAVTAAKRARKFAEEM